MSRRSFRLRSRRLPGASGAKPGLALLVALILAGCGGPGKAKPLLVRGDGFRFDAPASWTPALQGAANGAIDLVEVRRFKLARPYRHELLGETIRELDHDAGVLATKLGARVSSGQTTTVARRDARTYRLDYDGKMQEITFVFDESREYELICRLPAGADRGPCAQLRSSFTLT
jgi:hypothetical protein